MAKIQSGELLSPLQFFLFYVGGITSLSRGGRTRSRIQNLNSTSQMTSNSKLMPPDFDFFVLTILRGWGVFNGWSDAVKDANFEFCESNYP